MEPDPPDQPPPPPAPAPEAPRAAPALAFFGVLLLLVLPDLLAQSSSRLLGLAWSELFTLLLPALAAAAGSNLRPGRYLCLGRPRLAPVLLGLLLGGAGFVAANGVLGLWLMVLPRQVLLWFPDVARLFQGTALTRVVLTAVAGLLAPMCEEVAFRGYLQRTLARARGPVLAIGLTALLFALRHLDLVRFPALAGLGVLFGWLAWRSGSIWPAVAAHAANNGLALALALGRAGAEPAGPLEPPALQASLGLLLAGAALLGALGLAFSRAVPLPPLGEALPLRDPADPSTRFRPWLVPRPLLAAAALGVAGLFALLAAAVGAAPSP